MKKNTLLLLIVALVTSCTQKPEKNPGNSNIMQGIKINKGQVYLTAKDTEYRLSKMQDLEFEDFGQPSEGQPCVFIDPVNTFQEFIGIGASFTDAAAEVFAKLPEEKQQEFLSAYFDAEEGINYSFSRTHIASCDFSSGSYDYLEEGDSSLNSFSIEHDRVYRIPLIKKSMAAAGGNLKMIVSPWSPPAWMKDNNNRLQGGKLLPEYRQSWANHYIKFIEAYEAEGIPVWGLTVQNEPMAVQRWESCIYTASEERDFVKNHLGPTLEKEGMADRKLIVWDHNRDLIYQRASTILNDPEASKYIWGVGFHWYEPWTGSDMQFDNLKLVKESFPDKNLVFTEGCVESFNYEGLSDWRLGERYGYSMINDFNSGTRAWTDWNILLNENGGPNHVQNFCFAPVHADLSKGELIYTNSYYYIGHFSKFLEEGAKRLACSTNRDKLIATAFRNPDGTIVAIVMNRTDEDIPYKLWIQGRAASVNCKAHSISTFLI
ncbi:MAG: glycoside hydrolase family 30 protein [Bacteroidales bacterium]